MPLVFATITPHPPLLIPTIGKGDIDAVKQTQDAMDSLERELYVARPQIIIIITPHGALFHDAFSVGGHPEYSTDFGEFGDYSTELTWKGTPYLASKISMSSNEAGLPVRLVSREKLDHGACVPLYYLTRHLEDVNILPIGYSAKDAKSHLNFGELLKDVIMLEKKRVAVIASGDLSHALSTNAPAGYSKSGEEFDKSLIELLETKNTIGIASLDTEFVESAHECGYRSILILLGILKHMNYTFKNYSYEAPFGVGYLVGNFLFP